MHSFCGSPWRPKTADGLGGKIARDYFRPSRKDFTNDTSAWISLEDN
jgi:hypothetical protein